MSAPEVDIVRVVRQRVASCATGIDRNVRPTGPYVTDRQQDDAVELALAWYDAADDRRITVADLDMVASLASSALDAVRVRDRRLAAPAGSDRGTEG